MKRITICVLLGLVFFSCNRIDEKSPEFNSYNIVVVERIFETDSTTHAYFDKNTPRVTETQISNLGEYERDLTFDSIANLVHKFHPNASIADCDFSLNEVKFNPELGMIDSLPQDHRIIDIYYEKAIYYYYMESRLDTTNGNALYHLSLAWIKYQGLFSTHGKVIRNLDKVTSLNPDMEAAFLLLAEAHEQAGLFNGMMASEPHVKGIDWNEIALAREALNFALEKFPKSYALLDYEKEFKSKYDKSN